MNCMNLYLNSEFIWNIMIIMEVWQANKFFSIEPTARPQSWRSRPTRCIFTVRPCSLEVQMKMVISNNSNHRTLVSLVNMSTKKNQLIFNYFMAFSSWTPRLLAEVAALLEWWAPSQRALCGRCRVPRSCCLAKESAAEVGGGWGWHPKIYESSPQNRL